MASESHSGPWVSGTFLGLLVGKGGEKRDSLGGSPEKPVLLTDAQGLPLLSSPFPQVEQ